MPPLGDPNRGARHVSSWGVRVELLRTAIVPRVLLGVQIELIWTAVCATCHRGGGGPYNFDLFFISSRI